MSKHICMLNPIENSNGQVRNTSDFEPCYVVYNPCDCMGPGGICYVIIKPLPK
jgi:hypothetical protein